MGNFLTKQFTRRCWRPLAFT